MDYTLFYNKISRIIKKSPDMCKNFLVLNKILKYVMYFIYPVLLLYLYVSEVKTCGFASAFLSKKLLECIFLPAGEFTLGSFLRAVINRKRPYEEWDIDPIIKKEKMGQSFPSRHVFASVMISMTALYVCAQFGVFCLLLSALTAVVRVVGGVHYPSDVIAGYLYGVSFGLLYFI